MTDKYTLLQKVLKALGLSEERIQTILDWIEEWRAEDAEEAGDEGVQPAVDRYPYHLRDDFLSPAELDFYRILVPATAGWAVVCPKVRLGDLFKAVTPEYRRWRVATNKVNQKHVDFVLCEPQTMAPLLGIELNDSSHRREDRRKRDTFVVRTFAAAGLPLAGIKVQRSYPADRLARFLRQKAGATEAGSPAATEATSAGGNGESAPAGPPVCPTCGAEMVLRTARRGPNAGNQFWGCANYPGCREIVAYKESED